MSNESHPHFSGDTSCWEVSSCRGQVSGGSTDTAGDVRDTTNGLWHHYLLTTRPDGADGYNVYIDGVLRAADPYIEGVGGDRNDFRDRPANPPDGLPGWQTTGGDPTDPVGPIRLCGRAKPGSWVGRSDPWIWDERRYFLGKVAHFAVWDHSMTAEQAVALHNEYVTKYKLVTTPFVMPAAIPQPLAYYYLDEGHGWNLRESISGNSAAGVVTYDTSDTHPENANYTEPNWSEDEFFGSAITCACASYTFYPPPPALSRPLPPHAPRLQPVHSGCDRTQQVRFKPQPYNRMMGVDSANELVLRVQPDEVIS